MPSLRSYFKERDEGDVPRKLKDWFSLSMTKSSVIKPKYESMIKPLNRTVQETKAIFLRNMEKPVKVRKLLFKALRKTKASSASNINGKTEQFSRGGSVKENMEILGKLGELDADDLIRSNSLRLVEGRLNTCIAFKISSKAAWSAFNLFCKKKLVNFTNDRRISLDNSYAAATAGGGGSENEKARRSSASRIPPRSMVLTNTSVRNGRTAAKKMKEAAGGRTEEEDEGELWKKNILIGARCRLDDFNGALHYNESGNQLTVKETHLSTETLDLGFHLWEEDTDIPPRKYPSQNLFL